MTDTFHTKIPTLTDGELLQYLNHFQEYRTEAVEAALAELDRRGLTLPGEERAQIKAGLALREADALAHRHHSFVQGLGRTTADRLERIHLLTLGILAAGLGAAVAIYLRAAPKGPNPLGFEPEDTKKYLRDLELYGGKLNVLATEFSRWWDSLWHGRTLAYTVASLTLLLAFAFWCIASWRARDLEDLDGSGSQRS
jgi:hypothetical protein